MATEIAINSRMRTLILRDISKTAKIGERSKLEIIEIDGCLLTKDAFDHSQHIKRFKFPDLTGYEAFVNHVDFAGLHAGTRAIRYASDLLAELINKGERTFDIVCSEMDNRWTVRFYRVREGQSWLNPDLDGYTEESILLIRVK